MGIAMFLQKCFLCTFPPYVGSTAPGISPTTTNIPTIPYLSLKQKKLLPYQLQTHYHIQQQHKQHIPPIKQKSTHTNT
eukprot:4366103-Ditylum_brightwellii.AAC.1